jgi:hypothetical protein
MSGKKQVIFAAISFFAYWVPASGQIEVPKVISAEFPSVLKAKPLEPAEGDDEITKLRKVRYNATLRITVVTWVYHRRQWDGTYPLFAAARRLMQGGLELRPTPEEKLKWLDEMVEFCNKLEATMQNRPVKDHDALNELLEFRLDVGIERLKLEKTKKRP